MRPIQPSLMQYQHRRHYQQQQQQQQQHQQQQHHQQHQPLYQPPQQFVPYNAGSISDHIAELEHFHSFSSTNNPSHLSSLPSNYWPNNPMQLHNTNQNSLYQLNYSHVTAPGPSSTRANVLEPAKVSVVSPQGASHGVSESLPFISNMIGNQVLQLDFGGQTNQPLTAQRLAVPSCQMPAQKVCTISVGQMNQPCFHPLFALNLAQQEPSSFNALTTSSLSSSSKQSCVTQAQSCQLSSSAPMNAINLSNSASVTKVASSTTKANPPTALSFSSESSSSLLQSLSSTSSSSSSSTLKFASMSTDNQRFQNGSTNSNGSESMKSQPISVHTDMPQVPSRKGCSSKPHKIPLNVLQTLVKCLETQSQPAVNPEMHVGSDNPLLQLNPSRPLTMDETRRLGQLIDHQRQLDRKIGEFVDHVKNLHLEQFKDQALEHWKNTYSKKRFGANGVKKRSHSSKDNGTQHKKTKTSSHSGEVKMPTEEEIVRTLKAAPREQPSTQPPSTNNSVAGNGAPSFDPQSSNINISMNKVSSTSAVADPSPPAPAVMQPASALTPNGRFSSPPRSKVPMMSASSVSPKKAVSPNKKSSPSQ